MARVSKVLRSPQAVACGKRDAVELGKPREVPDVGTTRNGYTPVEARKGGKPGNGTNLEPTALAENHAPGGPETAIYPRGVLSGIVLGGGESPSQGEGSDGSTQPEKETRAGQVGPEPRGQTSLQGISNRAKQNDFARRESEYNRRTGCGKTARPGLCGGLLATEVPTVRGALPIEYQEKAVVDSPHEN
jgi:hypothetical protein